MLSRIPACAVICQLRGWRKDGVIHSTLELNVVDGLREGDTKVTTLHSVIQWCVMGKAPALVVILGIDGRVRGVPGAEWRGAVRGSNLPFARVIEVPKDIRDNCIKARTEFACATAAVFAFVSNDFPS